MKNNRVFITGYGSATSLGTEKNEIIDSLNRRNPLPKLPGSGNSFFKPFYTIPNDFEEYGSVSRSTAIAYCLFDKIIDLINKYKEVPLFLSTSTGGIDGTELEYSALKNGTSDYQLFNNHFFNKLTSDINKKYNNKFEKAMTFSTACSSSGHAILQAYKLIQAGIIERAVIFGIDVLSHTTMIGFDSLQLVCQTQSKPLTMHRDGLTLGEGAGILLLENTARNKNDFEVVGVASTSDGHHISSPDPEGKSQKKCIFNALSQAGIKENDISYVSAHGTGTVMNDQVEIMTLKEIFKSVPVSSLKSYIGHTLGASTIDEIALCIDMMETEKIYQRIDFTDAMDPMIPEKTCNLKVKYFLKNSFGFGGNNVSIVIKNNSQF